MASSPDLLRALLFAGMLVMALLAAFYLRRRRLSLLEYLGWGALIILLPLLGPFLVIALRPGKPFSELKDRPVK